MRLLFLPISTRRALIYCQRVKHANQINEVTVERQSLVDRATTRAAKLWAQWEKGDKRWQQLIVQYGNKALRRIPYEEWGLKSIPPMSARRRADERVIEKKEDVQVAFPSTVVRSDRVLDMLRRLAIERQPLHTRRFWWSVVGMPISAPIALIPIVPNIPFFYLAFRAWSHWRALSGSKHLEYLIQENRLRPSPSSALERVYEPRIQQLLADAKATDGSRPEGASEAATVLADHLEGAKKEEIILLELSDGRRCADALGLPELTVEVERAVEQVQESLRRSLQNPSPR